DTTPPDRKLPAKGGLNRFVWDLTHDGAKVIPGAKVDIGNPALGVPVAPRKHAVKATLGTQTQTTEDEVKLDSRGAPELRARFLAVVNGFMPGGFGFCGPVEDIMLARVMAEAERKAIAEAARRGLDELTPLRDQGQLAVRVRDDITKLSAAVARVRAL